MRPQADLRRAKRQTKLQALCLVPCAVVLLAASWHATSPQAPSFAGGVRKLEREQRTAMQYKKRSIALKKPFNSADAERFAEIEQEWRHERRSGQAKEVVVKPDMSKLPSTKDIFARKFTGESSKDPVGGRKWYSLYMVYRADGGELTNVQKHIKKMNALLQGRLSAKNVEVATMTPPKGLGALPLDGELDATAPVFPPNSWKLEMPMKVYGDVEKKGSDLSSMYAAKSPRATANDGFLVRWDFQLPPSAIEQLSKILYGEKTLLRFMFLKHTRQFHHAGEDNELLL
mmetsp:Transcript_41946/g.96257  ORF Transcript_41946/g.96257 Transcript_41946/m.96257 type:complete len:287 (-) Transcript_41946:74-934(-)